MAGTLTERQMLDSLDEPAFVVERAIVRCANQAARAELGAGIEGRDVRLAIRQPQALDPILSNEATTVEVVGLVEPGRSWRLQIRPIGNDRVLVRMIDRSDAVSAEKMRVDFVANASHELRTPLSTIIGYAETIAEDAGLSLELSREFGGTIRTEARRMLRIIEDLMSLSRIEADRFVPAVDTVDIVDVVRAAIANLAAAPGTKECVFAVHADDDVPAVRGDHAQLSQVFDNLLSNAARYGCAGTADTVDIRIENRDRWVRVSIVDRGPGIAREHLPRLTERFYRVDAARSRESGGTGLGLAIVKHIIDRHRGMLEIKSTIGIGTSVEVRLPPAG